jgi:uncharacterized protein (DUF2225 family)
LNCQPVLFNFLVSPSCFFQGTISDFQTIAEELKIENIIEVAKETTEQLPRETVVINMAYD